MTFQTPNHSDPNGSYASAVKLSIENNGETIPAEHLDRLFDGFYRVDASRQHFSEGAGLGLAITQSIAYAHGGGVVVRSDSGTTAFEMTISTALGSGGAIETPTPISFF